MKELKILLTLIGLILWLSVVLTVLIYPVFCKTEISYPIVWFIGGVIGGATTFVYIPKILLSRVEALRALSALCSVNNTNITGNQFYSRREDDHTQPLI